MERNEKLDRILNEACGKVIKRKNDYKNNSFLADYGTAGENLFRVSDNHACHAGMNNILLDAKTQGDVLWNLTSNYYSPLAPDGFLPAQKRMLEWMIGPESPYNEYIDRYPFTYEGEDIRSVDFVTKYGIFITNWKTWPSNVLCSYLIFLRMSWEYPWSTDLWAELVDRGINKSVAFFVANTFRSWDKTKKYTFHNPLGSHSMLDLSDEWSVDQVKAWLSNFVAGKFNPNKLNKPCTRYHSVNRNNSIFDPEVIGLIRGTQYRIWFDSNLPKEKSSSVEIDPWTGKPIEKPRNVDVKYTVDGIAHVAFKLERLITNTKEVDLDDENR